MQLFVGRRPVRILVYFLISLFSLGCIAATQAAVNLDEGMGQAYFATQIPFEDASGTTIWTGSDEVLAVEVAIGFNVSQGDSMYFRFDLENAVWAENIAGSEFDIDGPGEFTISSGGAEGDSSVIVELNAEGGNLPDSSTIHFSPARSLVTQQDEITIRYRLFDIPTDAINETNALKDVAATWFQWEDAVAMNCTLGTPEWIDVEDRIQWADGSLEAQTVSTVNVAVDSEVRNGEGELLEPLLVQGSVLALAGPTSGFETIVGMTLAGTPADEPPVNGMAFWSIDADQGIPVSGGFPLNDVELQFEPNGIDPMHPGSYVLSFESAPVEAGINIDSLQTTCGEIFIKAGLELQFVIDGNDHYAEVGELLIFDLLVTSTGVESVDHVVLNSAELEIFGCFPENDPTLEQGKTLSCAGWYQITGSDMRKHEVVLSSDARGEWENVMLEVQTSVVVTNLSLLFLDNFESP